MAYTPTSLPDPRFLNNAANLSQARRDAWNRVAEVASRLAESKIEQLALLEEQLGGALAFLRGLESYWVYPGINAVNRVESLAEIGHMEELAELVHDMIWRLGRHGDEGGLLLAEEESGDRHMMPADRHYFTALMVSDVDPSVLAEAEREIHAYRRPYDTLVYDFVGVRSFDATLAAVLLNNEIQAVVMRPDVPLRSGAAFGVFDRLLDEYDEEFGLSTSAEHRRARALATVLRRVRPHLDLYLLTDEAVPDQSDPTMLAFDRAFYRYESRSELHMTLINGVRSRLSTPFFDALKQYAERPIGNFHALPIARGNSVFNSPWMRDMVVFYGRNIFLAETSTTSGGLDSLLAPTGSLMRAQDKAAKTFGAQRTFFATNGTSTSNKIVVQALTKPDDVVLIDRNCHKSHHYGLILGGAHPVYLDAYPLETFAIYGGVPLRTIKKTLLDLRAAGRLDAVKMVLLTNCTFDGVTYNPRRVMEEVLAIKPDMVFLWDEAWFAFANVHPLVRRRTAMLAARDLDQQLRSKAYRERYAENRARLEALGSGHEVLLENRLLPDPQRARVRVYATQSTHKSLSALRQGSMIHIYDHDFERSAATQFHEAFNTHTSTSPNYQILASLDLARRQFDLEGYGLVARAYEIALTLRHRIANDRLLGQFMRVLAPEEMVPDAFAAQRDESLATQAVDDRGSWEHLGAAMRDNEFVLDPTRITLLSAAPGSPGTSSRTRCSWTGTASRSTRPRSTACCSSSRSGRPGARWTTCSTCCARSPAASSTTSASSARRSGRCSSARCCATPRVCPACRTSAPSTRRSRRTRAAPRATCAAPTSSATTRRRWTT